MHHEMRLGCAADELQVSWRLRGTEQRLLGPSAVLLATKQHGCPPVPAIHLPLLAPLGHGTMNSDVQ